MAIMHWGRLQVVVLKRPLSHLQFQIATGNDVSSRGSGKSRVKVSVSGKFLPVDDQTLHYVRLIVAQCCEQVMSHA
jgi:hypothetical protein